MAEGYKEKLNQPLLTDAGRHIFLQVGNGDGKLVYTRATLSSRKPVDSSGKALDDEAIRQITSLPDDLKEGQLQLTPVQNDHFDVIADFNNRNQPADIVFSCIGWFARVDTDKTQGPETLIAIGFTKNDQETLAAGSPDGLSTEVISAELDVTISDAANIDMHVNEIGYVTRAELNSWQTKVQESINTEFDTQSKALTVTLNGKADKSNTYTKTDVDSKVNEAKSNAQSTANQIYGEVNILKGKQTKDSADANALSETGVYYCYSPAKNFPVSQWGTLVTSNGNGARASQLYFPDDNSAVWFRTFNGYWRGWVRLANIGDVNNAESSLTSSINAKANQSALDATNANVTQLQNSKLNFKYISDGYDLLSADGFWGVMEANNAQNLKNLPNGMYNQKWMYVLKLIKDDFGSVIIFDQDNRIWINNKNGGGWYGWKSYAHESDVTALQNIINQQNQTIQSLTSRLNNAENEINYIKANYVEGRTFPASQEAQANSWENENPQRIAFITK